MTTRERIFKQLNELSDAQLINLSRMLKKPPRTPEKTIWLTFRIFEKWFNNKFGWFFTNGRKSYGC
jgi:hypothetical protein